jgi:predicted DsbA family dithiol-disulfide isomerase
MSVVVDVISDVICPWCYIGKRRLEKAIATHGEPVNVQWHPFQLNPTMPKEGISRKEYRTRKFGSWERSLELDYRTPNTVDAHRLIWLADQHDCQDSVVEGLFRAYFTEGRDIGNRQTLIDVAAEAGLDRQAAEAMLNSGDGMDVIEEAGELSQRHQVTGVPFFIINNAITLSGAQEPETFLDAFRQTDVRS